MRKLIRVLAVCCVISPVLSGCGQGSESSRSGNAVSEYTAILATLEATRRDVHNLRDDIAELRSEVNALKSLPAQAAAPAAPSPGLQVDEVSLDGKGPVVGSPEATLAIVEFTDYECPFCARFHEQSLPQLKESYIDTGKIKMIVRNLPLDFHPNSTGAALAANCAAEQDAYETMRQGIFANQQTLGPALYKQLAETSNLDMNRFEKCQQDPENAQAIRADSAYATSLGITGTPSFFIGRIEGDKLVEVTSLVGALPFDSFAVVIDGLL